MVASFLLGGRHRLRCSANCFHFLSGVRTLSFVERHLSRFYHCVVIYSLSSGPELVEFDFGLGFFARDILVGFVEKKLLAIR